jgi:hypothetical protein
MDFKVLKIENIVIDEEYNINYINSKNEKKKLQIMTPLLYLPFGLDKDKKNNLVLNLQLRRTKCYKHNEELKLFLNFLDALENIFNEKTGKNIKSNIRKNADYDPIINTKIVKHYNKIVTETYKDKEHVNIYKINKEIYLKTIIIIDKLWEFNDLLFYKFNLKEIFISV